VKKQRKHPELIAHGWQDHPLNKGNEKAIKSAFQTGYAFLFVNKDHGANPK
jgi:hypothetical protein